MGVQKQRKNYVVMLALLKILLDYQFEILKIAFGANLYVSGV